MTPHVESTLRSKAMRSRCNMRHAAAVLANGAIVCAGFNRGDIHAEADVLRKWRSAYLPRGRDADTIVVVRIGKDGSWRMSKPCPACQQIIEACGLDVVHT